VNRHYFFASLFVRTAKSLAIIVALIGIGFCVLRYYQASVAVGAVAYQPSPQLQRALDKLKDSYLSAQQIVDSFNEGNQSAAPGLEPPRFPLVVDSAEDFTRIAAELSRLDQVRGQLKDSIVGHFEERVKSIEGKLHAYAAALRSAPSPAPASNADPSPDPPPREESLFSQLGVSDANDRRANLNERKEFLKTLATKAENADNRATLSEATEQLERLSKLLPEKFDAASAAEPDSPAKGPGPEPSNSTLLSERVAHQLEQLRGAVRQVLLTSWTIDDAFKQATDLSLTERDKDRAATLAEQGIWLSATSRIVIGLLATGLACLVILVFADLVQTQLDTATNSSTVADAINSLRGSVTHLSEPTSILAPTPKPTPMSEPTSILAATPNPAPIEDDWPAAGGS
jgi:hypothetical protein